MIRNRVTFRSAPPVAAPKPKISALPVSNSMEYGCAVAASVDKTETIEVPSVGGGQPRVLSRHILAEIVEPRVEEIFMLVQHELQKCGMEEILASGIVITGGSTLLSGMPELAEEVLGVPVRRGRLWVMVAYHLGQFALVGGAALHALRPA